MVAKPRPAISFVTILASLSLIVSACSSGGAASPAAPTLGSPGPVATPSATPGGPVTSLTGVQSAVVRINVEGSFVDPAAGASSATTSGSGFVIDSSGIVVTNNHVVTGAALVRVWVGGATQSVRARLLGASECSDLAVLALEGGPYPYLTWYPNAITPGLDVYVAGYPLSTTEYTLTRGIISKARASGATSWSSVDAVIEHDAVINAGDSGGPLVAADGTVVGINYSTNKTTNQSWAIAQKEATAILDQLRAGHDVLSIGINSRAINDGKGTQGIWVSAVKSGSPADKAGLKPGDLITKMENLKLADNGTMADYCDILRAHTATDTLSLVVQRASTKEVLEGQLNGRALEVTSSFGDQYGQTGSSPSPGASPATADYMSIHDGTGVLKLDVPTTWKETQTGDWKYENKVVGVRVVASPNIQKWVDGWDTAGTFVAVSKTIAKTVTPSQYLARTGGNFTKACTDGGLHDYTDGRTYVGAYHLWTKCGGLDSTFVDLAVNPMNKSFLLVVQFTGLTKADFDALDRMLTSVTVSF